MNQSVSEPLAIDPSHQALPADSQPAAAPKIGGWLYLPATGLVIGILFSLANFAVALSLAGDIPNRYTEIFTFTLLAELGFFAFIVYAATRFFGKRRNAPAMMIAMMAGGVALYLLLVVVSLAADAEPFAVASGEMLVRNVIGAAIWIPYFRVSKRVKETFVMP